MIREVERDGGRLRRVEEVSGEPRPPEIVCRAVDPVSRLVSALLADQGEKLVDTGTTQLAADPVGVVPVDFF